MAYNMRNLANSLVNNGQHHLPPNDVIRQGQVIGYDPGWNGSTHAHPTVSIQLAGDLAPVHGIRFGETYTPNIGDTVWVVMSGEDAWVMSRLVDVPNGNNNSSVRTPTQVSLAGWKFGDLNQTITGSATPISLTASALTTPLLPNHLYKAEATVNFNITNGTALPQDAFLATWANNSTTLVVTNSYGTTLSDWIGLPVFGDGIPANATIVTAPGTTTGNITISGSTTKTQNTAVTAWVTVDHFVGLYVSPPDTSMTALVESGYQEIAQGRVVEGADHTWSGSTIWYHNPTSSNYPSNWTTLFPNAEYTWYLGVKSYSNGGSTPTVVLDGYTFAIYDLGIAT